MSNELEKQVTIDEAVSDVSRGQTSDQEDLMESVRAQVDEHFDVHYEFVPDARNLENFFVEQDYWFLLSRYVQGVMPTRQFNGFRRYIYLGANDVYKRFVSVSCYLDGDEFVFHYYAFREWRISVADYLNKGFEYVRNIVFEVAGLKISSYGQIVPRDTSEIFDRCLYKIGEDLNGITQNSIDIIMRVGDLRCCSNDTFRLYGCRSMNEFLAQEFGLSSTTIKNMLSVYDKFFEHAHLKMGYEDYSYSQLVELCSVNSKDLDKFDESMSVREIKAKKRELAKGAEKSEAPGQHTISPCVEKDDAPLVRDEATFASSEEAHEASEGVVSEAKARPTLSFQAAIDGVKEMQNPYYVPGKEKQSARYDAYANALHDVLEKLDEILSASLKSAVEA